MSSTNKKKMVFSHDGSADDCLALLLATTFENVDLLGVIVTDGDCYGEAAVSISRKILGLTNQKHVSVAISEACAVHPFPKEWRVDSLRIDKLPILNDFVKDLAPRSTTFGVEFLIFLLEETDSPITIVEVGPLTTLALAFGKRPDLINKVEKVVWMGGALDVKGNVSPAHEPLHNGSAEWNSYWDARSVQVALKLNIPFVICPLDLTEKVPLTSEFLAMLTEQRLFRYSDFAGQCYALNAYRAYQAWDVLATAYVGFPEIFSLKTEFIDVVSEGPSEGRIFRSSKGTKVEVLAEVDVEKFWSIVAHSFRHM